MEDFCPVTGEPVCRCSADMEPVSIPRHKDALRKLFTDHAVFTKMLIVAFLDSRPEADVTQTRLLRNQREIGVFFGSFLGIEAGVAIGNLFTEHIKLAAEVLATIKSNSNLDPVIKRVFGNVRDVAIALSTLPDSHASYDEVYKEFGRHNEFVVEIAKLHYAGKYKEEIDVYDRYYVHMLHFSNILYKGLIE
jgi:hypothetical protein